MKKILTFAICILTLSLSAARAELSVSAVHSAGNEIETAEFTCLDENGAAKWSVTYSEPAGSDVDFISWYVSKGTSPVLYVNRCSSALCALDVETGSLLWEIPVTQKIFGASNSMVCGDDGSLYIGGWYGPDPICVSGEGNILWTSDSSQAGEDVYMLFCLLPLDGGLAAFYDGWNEGGNRTGILYDYTDGSAAGTLDGGLCACVQALSLACGTGYDVMTDGSANLYTVEQILICLSDAPMPDEAVLDDIVSAYLRSVCDVPAEQVREMWDAVDAAAQSLLSGSMTGSEKWDASYDAGLFRMLTSAIRRATNG